MAPPQILPALPLQVEDLLLGVGLLEVDLGLLARGSDALVAAFALAPLLFEAEQPGTAVSTARRPGPVRGAAALPAPKAASQLEQDLARFNERQTTTAEAPRETVPAGEPAKRKRGRPSKASQEAQQPQGAAPEAEKADGPQLEFLQAVERQHRDTEG